MFGKKIWLAATVVYVAVLGCVAWPQNSPASPEVDIPTVSIKGLKPYCGIVIRLQRVDWIDRYIKLVDKAADMGVDTVEFVVEARQENASSCYMYVDTRFTPTVDQLTQIINHAKKDRGLRVVLMPEVLLDNPAADTEWRGVIDPQFKGKQDWNLWFSNYRGVIEHYARIAQGTNVDVLVIGSELNSSLTQVDPWIDIIKSLRVIFKGQLTYSANWDRYYVVPFWKYLDLMGMNSYWTLSDKPQEKAASVNVDELKQSWKKIQNDLFTFQKTLDKPKPILFTEVGWCSLSNAAKDPWDYTDEKHPTLDNEIQRKLYQAFFEAWWGKPQLGGFSFWELNPDPDPDGKGYTPEGKPAEQILRDWMHKPKWDVMDGG